VGQNLVVIVVGSGVGHNLETKRGALWSGSELRKYEELVVEWVRT